MNDFAPVFAALTTAEYLSSWGSSLWNIFRVVLGLGFVIFVHELGHFLAAKYFGVKCEKFYVGFDVPIKLGPIRIPAKLFHFQWGETEYGVGSIPLGGYVKMLGQDDDPRNAEKENERIKLRSEESSSKPSETTVASPVIPAPAPTTTNGDAPFQYDPRSFPAKSVFARMVIISAGVIMNIIFGVVFAAIAFMYGVAYDPVIVADAIPGDPAWVAGIQSGDRIVRVGNMAEPDEKLAFRDLREAILMAGFAAPNDPIPVEVDRDGERLQFNIVGTKKHDENGQILGLGFSLAKSTRVSSKAPIGPWISSGWPAAKDYLPDLKARDVIVGINGTQLPLKHGFEYPLETDLNQLLHPAFDQTVTLQIQRPSSDPTAPPTAVDVEWKPLPMRTAGFAFAPGAVNAIRDESPAASAGVQVGDRILTIDGVPALDAFTLQLQVAKKKGESVTVVMSRGNRPSISAQSNSSESNSSESNSSESDATQSNETGSDDSNTASDDNSNETSDNISSSLSPRGVPPNDESPTQDDRGDETYEFTWEVPETFVLRDAGQIFNPSGIELPGSGFTFLPTKIVSFVDEASGSGLGLQAGDVIRSIRMAAVETPEQVAEMRLATTGFYSELVVGVELKGGYNSQFLHSLIQNLPVGQKLVLSFVRDGKVMDTEVKVGLSEQWSWFDRGLILQPAEKINQASSFVEAVVLGVTEIKKRALGVIRFVGLAVTGRIPSNAANGPAAIFYVATDAASQGTPKLLMFLTMLSANLAVINFLPIPALDGGHMMFLIYEAIFRKPVNEAVQIKLTILGVLLLLSLMLFVTFNDIMLFTKLFGS